MAANLFGDRFFSNREPAWHGLGLVCDTPMSAQEAFSASGSYDVQLVDLMPRNPALVPGLEIKNRAIVRDPVPDDPNFRVLGMAGPEYTLVTPLDVCEVFDASVGQSVETLGSLGKGEMLFISTFLPDINVKGDPVKSYLLITSPYSGMEALRIRITGVRVVCQNTLQAARAASSEVFKVVHDRTAKERLGTWLQGIYTRAVDRSKALEQAFVMFSDYSPGRKTVPNIIEKIYSYPVAPSVTRNAPEEVIEKRTVDFDLAVKAADRSRQAVAELFEGKGTGMDLPGVKGTGWGLYNAVAEWENYRYSPKPEVRKENLLIGNRAAAIERAYVVVEDYARNSANRRG